MTKENKNKINKKKSPFDITINDVQIATTRFEKEGSRVMVGNRKGIAGISLLKNKYYRARSQAVNAVTVSNR